jgi:hypothetical protein
LGILRVKADLVSLSVFAFVEFKIVNGIAAIVVREFLLSEYIFGPNLQESVVIRLAGFFAYNNGCLVIIDLEDNEFRAFAEFEFLKGFGAGGIDGNARARLLLANNGVRVIPFLDEPERRQTKRVYHAKVNPGESRNSLVDLFLVHSPPQCHYPSVDKGRKSFPTMQ